ncbi:unnamed protein product [Heterobilharzia americana]|nr:unnamed protein product [Heterobilharzia americana]
MRNTEANGNNRSSRVRDRPNPYENSIATNPILLSPPGSNISTAVGNNNNNDKGTQNNASTTQIPYWTHLLPYRTSTVPQNLSGRLRKSETLPNDWINHDANKSTDHEKYSFSKSTSYQLNTLNQTHNSQCFNYSEECKPRSYVNHQYNNYTNNNHSSDSDHKKAKSPPPRPPIRTSSHNVSRQTPISLSPQSSASRSPCCHHLHCRKHLSQGLLNSSTKSNINGNSNNNVFVQDSTNSSINESPVLCRYSQLYSLNTQNK